MRRALFIGVGRAESKSCIGIKGLPEPDETVTCDYDPNCNPDVLWDLNKKPWPFEDDSFEEIHAYEVLEHLGTQGDAVAFFADFWEIYRILKNGGLLYGSCPGEYSPWLLAEPSHRRVILPHTLNFLSQSFYEGGENTVQSDFRHLWKGNLVRIHAFETPKLGSHTFLLQAQGKKGEDCLEAVLTS